MEKNLVRLISVNFIFFCTHQFGSAQHNYKIFTEKRGSGPKLKAHSNISSVEDCSAMCFNTNTCLSATFKSSDPGYCTLFSLINTHIWGGTDYLATHVEIDVLKGNYGCHNEREIHTGYLKCHCNRDVNGIYCETLNQCPLAKGYKVDRQKCFKYVADEKKQEDASLACQREGGHLLTLENTGDIDMIIAEASSNGASNNAMSWIDGGQLKQAWNGGPLPFESWTPGSGNPSCVSLCHHDELMEEWACANSGGYFCQIDI